MAPHRFLHVANGHSTTGTIHAAGIPGTSSIWADVLHQGPVPAGLSDEDLLEVRARQLAGPPGAVADTTLEDVRDELKAWRAAVDDHVSYEELVLWYEHDLFDQLNLIQVLSRIARVLPAAKPVSLICIGTFPGRPAFKGLGELTPDELASLFETRQRIGEAHYALADCAWQAFRAPDPLSLEDLSWAGTPALPFLGPALQRHLEEFPWTSDGLSRSERRLMELAHGRSIDLWRAFPRMHDRETAFYIADGSFWQLVQDLASATPPLVAVVVASDGPGRLPQGTISLTDIGRAVLSGGVDRVKLCGLRRWLGGVHLDGSGSMWRWDPVGGRLVIA